ncbi:MAG: uroporphyrinogen-III synthase [Gemmatimonadota bacterium]|nr:uroporphyrinogen-III synthase [Gemmatimonadota bacterium]
MAEKGIVFIVGTGPDLPALLTVRGRELLATADAVVYERKSQHKLIPGGATGGPERYYTGPRGKTPRTAPVDVAALLVTLARKDLRVVHLMHGDPLSLGRGTDLVTALHDATVQFEVVPGVNPGNAASTYAGVPLLSTTLASTAIFANGRNGSRRSRETDWSAIARVGGTVVVRNAIPALPAIVAGFATAGVGGEIPAAAISRPGRPEQRTVIATLGTLEDAMLRAGMSGAATVIIGWTVVLRDEIAWFDTRPLFGVRIVLARQRHGPSRIGEALRELGASVIEVPRLGVARLDLDRLRDAITDIGSYEWLVLSSPDAVQIFWEQLLLAGRDTRALAGLRVACVDPATAAALLDRGVTADVTQEKFEATALIDALTDHPEIPGAALLYVADDATAEPFARDLEQAGAVVTALSVYRDVPLERFLARFRRAVAEHSVDLIVAMSPAAAEDYLRAAGDHASASIKAAAYDASTAHVLQDAGVEVVIIPPAASTESLVTEIRGRLGKSRD